MNNTNPSSTPLFSGKPTPPPYTEDGGGTTPPPFNDGVTPQLFEEPVTPQRHRPIEPLKKNVVNKVVLIAAVILVVALLLIGYYAVKKTAVAPVTKKTEKMAAAPQADSDSDSHITYQEITGEEAEAMMREHMAEMEKMEKIMEEMMAGDPFADMDRMEEMMGDDEFATTPPSYQEHKRKPAKSGEIRLAGSVGNGHFVMVLNTKDPNNITGTAATVVGGKERTQYRLLGIGSGRDLTVSVYDKKNKIVGTLSGTYDGYEFSGVYTTDDGESPFRMMAQ